VRNRVRVRVRVNIRVRDRVRDRVRVRVRLFSPLRHLHCAEYRKPCTFTCYHIISFSSDYNTRMLCCLCGMMPVSL